MPSIACPEQNTPGQWDYHFVLVKPGVKHVREETAVAEANSDLEMAYEQREETGSDAAMAMSLRAEGYISDFRIVQEEPDSPP